MLLIKDIRPNFLLNAVDKKIYMLASEQLKILKGGNIIRRNKTLKAKDLKRNGIESPEEIAKIANEGVGIMSGYKEVLGEKGDQVLANWIWEQSQKAWTQG